MTADPPPEPPKLHPAVAAPLLPFVLVYEGLRWVGRAVASGLPPVGRFLAWVLTPLRVLADAVGGVLAWIGHGCRRVLAGARDVLAPTVRLLTAPLSWLGRKISRLLWKLDHGVARLWQQTSTVRRAVARVADAVLGAARHFCSMAMAPFRPLGRVARRVSLAVRTFSARIRRTFRR